MLKKLLLAGAVTGLVASAAIPVQAAESQGQMTCKDAALMKHPNDRSARLAYKKSCEQAFEAQNAPAEDEPTYPGDL